MRPTGLSSCISSSYLLHFLVSSWTWTVLGVGSTLSLPSYVGISYIQGRLKLGLNGFICDPPPPGFPSEPLISCFIYSFIQLVFICERPCARHGQWQTALICPALWHLPCSEETDNKKGWKSMHRSPSGSKRVKEHRRGHVTESGGQGDRGDSNSSGLWHERVMGC